MFGCGHEHTTRAFTLKGRTYIVCTDCGTEIEYDMARMALAVSRVDLRRRNLRRSTAVVAAGLGLVILGVLRLCL